LSRFDSGAYTVACSFCVQSAILSALMCSPYSLQPWDDNSSSSEDEDEDRQAPVPAATTSGASELGIGDGSRRNNLGRLLRSVPRGATCWLRTGVVWTCAVLWIVCSINQSNYFIVRLKV